MKRLIDAVMTMPNQSDRRAQTEWLLGASRSLLHASNVVLARLENLIDGQDWRARWFAQQGFRDDALIQPHLDQRLCLDPSEPVFRRIDGDHVVRIRQELVADDIWYASPHVMEVRRAWDVDHCMYSTIYLDDAGNATCLCAFRQWGDKTPFTARDALMLEILHASFAKRVKEVDDVPGGPFTLSPRQAEVLAWLQQGLSEKEVGQRLKISQHTVHSHVVVLYRLYEAHSRAELLAKTLGNPVPVL